MSGKVKNNWDSQWKWLVENQSEALKAGFTYSLEYCQSLNKLPVAPLKPKEHQTPVIVSRKSIETSFEDDDFIPGVLDFTNEARQIANQTPNPSNNFLNSKPQFTPNFPLKNAQPAPTPSNFSSFSPPTNSRNSFQDDFSDLDRIELEEEDFHAPMNPNILSTSKPPNQPYHSPNPTPTTHFSSSSPVIPIDDDDFELPTISPPSYAPTTYSSPPPPIVNPVQTQPSLDSPKTPNKKNARLSEFSSDKKFSWGAELKKNARNIFGHREFRPFQLEAMNAVLSGKDVFVLMPTGGGKSLCYQLPAVTSIGVSIVISPLVALIRDQVESLHQNGVEADYVGSGQTEERTQLVYQNLLQSQPSLKLIYVTPEKLMQSPKLLRILDSLYARKLLSCFVVDEAHCVSHWGHEFRPDYMQLNLLRDKYPTTNIMALTATATERVQQDIINQLRLKDPIVIQSDFNRPNLYYEVRPKKGKKADEEILEYIREHVNQTGIIYCLSRNECEEVAQFLQKNGVSADFYHAQLDSSVRNRVQEQWLNDDIQVIVATIAFGLGINKPEVRFVIHYAFPKSIEGYYQESGRAGRDGGKSECILYYHYKDKRRVEFLINSTVEEAKQNGGIDFVYEKQLFENLARMVGYCENKVDCRRKLQLEYFGVPFDRKDCNQGCDNCKNQSHTNTTVLDMSKDAFHAVLLVEEMLKICDRITLTQVGEVFRGKLNKGTKTKGLESCSLCGCGSQFTKTDSERFLRFLTNEKKVFKEQTVMNGMGFPSTYLMLNVAVANEFKRNKPVIQFSLTAEKRTASASTSSSSSAPTKKRGGDHASESMLKDELRKLRTEIAKEEHIPPYMVFSENSLDEMCIKKPRNLDDFYNINGVGKIKLTKYGERFIAKIVEVLSRGTQAPAPKAVERTNSTGAKKSPYFKASKEENLDEIDLVSSDEESGKFGVQASKRAHLY